MSRKHCKRKHYPLINTVTYVTEGMRVLDKEKLDGIRTLELSAIESFAKGMADMEQWTQLWTLMKICQFTATNIIGPEALQTCESAYQHLTDALRRYDQTGKMGLTGPGLCAVRELFAWHDTQRTSISLADYERCINGAAAEARKVKSIRKDKLKAKRKGRA